MTGIPVVRLESLFVDLLLTTAKRSQLTISLDYAHYRLGVFLPLLQRHFTIPLHELVKPNMILRHDELAVVTNASSASHLVNLLLRLGQMWERESNIGQKDYV
jgi:hypothetical protein